MKKLVLSLAIVGLSLSGDCFANNFTENSPSKDACGIVKQEILNLGKNVRYAVQGAKSALIKIGSTALKVKSTSQKHKKALCVAAVFAAAGALDYHMVSSGKWSSGVLPTVAKITWWGIWKVCGGVTQGARLAEAATCVFAGGGDACFDGSYWY